MPTSTATKQPVTPTKPQTSPMPPQSSSQTGPGHDKIAMRAYQKWVQRGCPQGSEQQDWLEAEAELRREMGGQVRR
jgi:hypothetical protein